MSDAAPTKMLSTANVTGSIGSTLAGVSAILAGLSNTVMSSGLPTTGFGWVTFVGSLLAGIGATFGK
jgi:hypothetical protein